MKNIGKTLLRGLTAVGKGFLRGLRAIVPVIQDPPSEWVRKVAFWMALIVFVGAGYYLTDELWWQPEKTKETQGLLRDWYLQDGESDFAEDEEDSTIYPEGMNPAFRRLYKNNSDVQGWITFRSGNDDAIFEGAIDNPIVQSVDNDVYLNKDFWGKYNKSGTLFFDYRNDLRPGTQDDNWIIYGHNLNSQLMFSRFNWLATGRVDRARLLTTLTMNTLYEQGAYKIFAVMVVNAEPDEGPVFNYLRTRFNDPNSFIKFVEEIRRRSVYDFNDVDVLPGDRLLTLSTCGNPRDTHLKEGRVVVVARRVREDESPEVDVSKTVLNEDALYPLGWYVKQNLEIPEEYRQTTTTSSTVTTTTTLAGGTTATGESVSTTTVAVPTLNGTTATTVQNATTATGASSAGGTTATTPPAATTTTVQNATTTAGEATTTATGDVTTTTAAEEPTTTTTVTTTEENTTTTTQTTVADTE